MKKLLNFLNTIATHEKMVKKLDEEIAPVLAGEVKLIEYQNWSVILESHNGNTFCCDFPHIMRGVIKKIQGR